MQPADLIPWIQEIAALILLVPAVLAFLYLRRRYQGHSGFTDRDWLFLFGQPREKVLSLQLWIKFFALLLVVVLIGFALGFYLLPHSVGWFLSALLLTAVGVLLIAPKWLR